MDLGQALSTVFGWAEVFWRLVFVGTLLLALSVIVELVLRRRWLLARDVLAALVVLLGLGMALGGVVDSDWVPLEPHLLSQWGFPELRLASAVATLAVSGPELAQPVRRLAIWLVPLAAVGMVAIGAALPSAALGALALGLGSAALVRLGFGTAAAVPPIPQVRCALRALGVEVTDLRSSERQRVGSAEYYGRGEDGSTLRVRVLGRDAQDTQRLARRWRLFAYRDPPRSAPVGRLEQVEHEALATLMAAEAGVRVPEVVAAGLSPDRDAILVTREPDVEPLELSSPDDVSDEALEALWSQVARLHAAGISHGRLNAGNVVVVDGAPMLTDFSAATLAAPDSTLDIDVAELLVACTVLVGPDRAMSKAVAAGRGDAVAKVMPYLQRAALTPHLRDLARSHEVGLEELREAIGAATGTEVPKIAPLRRVRVRDLVQMALVIFAAYLLITKLAELGLGTIVHELRGAELAWVVVALILAQCTFVASGIAIRGAVATPLALLPCVVLQSAIKFINLTVPSSAGRIGMNLRFLQTMGVPRAQALAAGAIDDASRTIARLALLLLTLPFVGAYVDTSQLHVAGPDTRLLAGIAVAVVVSVAVLLGVPKFRAKAVADLRSALSGVWSVARVRRKRVELFGGGVGVQLLYALALGASCLAYGVDLNLAQLLFINTSASVLSSVIPTPGGIGAAEAALSAGLITMGVDESTAFAIAVTQRLCTFYLPPVWGYFSLRWLDHKGYV